MLDAAGQSANLVWALIWPGLLILALIALGLCLWLVALSRRKLAASQAEADGAQCRAAALAATLAAAPWPQRSEEHTSELQSLMRYSYAVLCLKKKTKRHEVKNSHLGTQSPN